MNQLATTAVREALRRSGVEPERIGHVVMGNVIPTDVRDAYLDRVAAIEAGISNETPTFNVNRLCGSGLQAIISAAQTLMLRDADIAIGREAAAPTLCQPRAGARAWATFRPPTTCSESCMTPFTIHI